MQSNLLLVLAVAAVVYLTQAAKLPKHWGTCKRHDPNLSKCLLKVVNEVMVDLMNGVPSLGMLPLNPLHLIRLDLDQGTSAGPVAVNLTFIDVDIHGFKSAVLNSIDMDWDKVKSKGSLSLSEPVVLLGNYTINGKVLVLPITGHGKCNFTLTDVSIDLAFSGHKVERKGKKYIHGDVMTTNLKQSRVYMQLENLFNGDKALGDNMNKFMNENWQEVYGAFKDTLQRGLGQAFLAISNRIWDRVPLDQVAPL